MVIRDDADLLRAAIEASGLSARRFAVEVLLRDERTIRRWLQPPDQSGARPLPRTVRTFLTRYIAERAK